MDAIIGKAISRGLCMVMVFDEYTEFRTSSESCPYSITKLSVEILTTIINIHWFVRLRKLTTVTNH